MIQAVTKREIFERVIENRDHIAYAPVNNENELRIASKVIELYFRAMFESIFAGYIWRVPRFGYFHLEAKDTTRRPITKRYYKKQPYLVNSHAINPKLIDKTVKFCLTGEFIAEHKVHFRACPTMRKKLTELLFNTDYGERLLKCRKTSL